MKLSIRLTPLFYVTIFSLSSQFPSSLNGLQSDFVTRFNIWRKQHNPCLLPFAVGNLERCKLWLSAIGYPHINTPWDVLQQNNYCMFFLAIIFLTVTVGKNA